MNCDACLAARTTICTNSVTQVIRTKAQVITFVIRRNSFFNQAVAKLTVHYCLICDINLKAIFVMKNCSITINFQSDLNLTILCIVLISNIFLTLRYIITSCFNKLTNSQKKTLYHAPARSVQNIKKQLSYLTIKACAKLAGIGKINTLHIIHQCQDRNDDHLPR